ncbi:MAG TPA: heparinase II/III family protein, partial [Prolixibacteraceae bacterium]|nr:heparinase II/III family protein [Prolixibacteraceae bacterium]
MKPGILLIYFMIFVSQLSLGQANWQKINSVDEVCDAYPEQIKSIFLNMNLGYPGLEEVRKAYTANDIPLACTKLLEYYGKSVQVRKELPSVAKQSKTEADSILMDIFTFQNVTGKVPRITDGRLKWDCMGPENDIEWAW